MREILCVASQLQVVNAMKKYFTDGGFKFCHLALPVSDEALLVGSDTVVVLMSPIVCNGKYLSAELPWKQYLREHLPNNLLIIAGFSDFQGDNYLDLLHLPKNIKAFLNRAEIAGGSWEPAYTGGLDVAEQLRRFFEGHGDESVTDELNNTLRILKIARDEMKRHQAEYQSVWKDLLLANRLPSKWNTLNNRWINYYPNFECLPFFGTFVQVNLALQHIAPYFNSNCEEEALFWELDCIEHLEHAKSALVKIEQHYVK
ncbi:MAG: hypothetical protein DHS20C18_30660 [Saprospiraceae bacterium]|nr:MAG: hypothetical protein DHS20C18_30660 [Saprospiraceae bacterium]